MINHAALCAHCKATYSRYVNDESLQRWIGSLNSMNVPTFLKYSSEVQSLFALCLQGRIGEIQPKDFSTLSLVPNDKELVVKSPDLKTIKPTYVPKEKVLRDLISLDGAHAEVQKIWAASMKLKTAVMPRVSSRPSQRKMKEHMESITMSFTGDYDIFEEIHSQIRLLTDMLIKQSGVVPGDIEEYFLPLTHHPMKEKSFTSITSDGLRAKSAQRYELQPFNLKGILRLGEIQDIYLEDPDTFVSRAFTGYPCTNCSFDIGSYTRIPNGTTPLNIIGFIPKPGDKERVVAIPTALMQSLSYPIGKIAKRINSSWKVQGVDSHANCCEEIHRLIRDFKGTRMFYSVDMSNFTDRLPYQGLISVIVDELVSQGILKPVDRLILETICNGKILIGNQIRVYGVGTPMGTFPSFPLASLANGVIGAIAFAKAHLNGDVTKVRLNLLPMRIIGDDIVIWDKETFIRYKEIMDRLGVEVQDPKCLQSTYVAEMCSKIITDQGVFQQRRIDSLYSNSEDVLSLIDLYKYYGRDILEFCRPEDSEAIETLSRIPEPYGLAPELDDPYWDVRPEARKIYKSMELGRLHTDQETRLNARDFEIIRSRGSLYPKDLKYELKVKDNLDIFKANALKDSLEQDIMKDYKVLLSEHSSFVEKLEASERIQATSRGLETLIPHEYFDKERIHEDFHLCDPDLTRKLSLSAEGKSPKTITWKGSTVSRSFNKILKLDEQISTQEKEDSNYGITETYEGGDPEDLLL